VNALRANDLFSVDLKVVEVNCHWRRSNPFGAVNVVGIKIGGRYIACGNGTWLGITNAPAGWGETVACVRP
jgi:hypothetical protein